MQPRIAFLQVLFLAFFAFSVSAQTVSSELVTPFLYKNDNAWSRSYEGNINGIHDIILSLDSNGDDCWGTLQYKKSKVTLNVEGVVDGTKLLLNETDFLGRKTGNIAGLITPDAITADWSNNNNTIGARLSLNAIIPEKENAISRSPSQWVRAFEGTHRDRKVYLILQSDPQKPLMANFYFPEEPRTYTGEAVYEEENNSLHIALADENRKDGGVIKINYVSPDSLYCIYQNSSGYNKFFSLKRSFSIDPGLFEYASYASSYYAAFPLVNGEDHFNEIIMEVVNGWSENAHQHYSSIVWELTQPKPEHRNAIRGYIWFNVDFLSEDLISGSLTYSNTWDRDYKVFSFNYHFGQQKLLDRYDIIEKNSGYGQYVQKLILEDLAKRPFNEDLHYFNWVKRQDFDYFNIRKEGLVFRTNYSPIYGTQEVTIPYTKLKRFFKKNNPIKAIAK
ncbi:MAG: hypothetical protein AAF502_02650 [Bacteroidota bacterium]